MQCNRNIGAVYNFQKRKHKTFTPYDSAKIPARLILFLLCGSGTILALCCFENKGRVHIHYPLPVSYTRSRSTAAVGWVGWFVETDSLMCSLCAKIVMSSFLAETRPICNYSRASSSPLLLSVSHHRKGNLQGIPNRSFIFNTTQNKTKQHNT